MTTPTDTPRTLTLEEMAEEYATSAGLPTKTKWIETGGGDGAYLTYEVRDSVIEAFLAGARAALSMAEVREMRNAFYYFLGIAPVQASGWLRAEKALIAFDQLMEGVE